MRHQDREEGIGRRVRRRQGLPHVLTVIVVSVASVAACQDRDDSSASESATPAATPEVPPAARDALTPAELTGIDVASIRLTLPWNTGQTSRPGSLGAPTLLVEGVETTTIEAMDRLVLRFSDGPDLPGYEVEYVEAPVDGCGEGRPLESDAPAFLRIRLGNVQAHDRSGAATFEAASPTSTGLPRLREIHLTCDGQAQVEWILGLSAASSYRVLEVRDPLRLVLDVRD